MTSRRPARPLESAVVLEEGLRLGSHGWRTTLPRSLRGGATRAARGRDWVVSRPHAEELKELLCCDRGRAARPSELGEGALGGRVLAGEGEGGTRRGRKDRAGMEAAAREKKGPRERR